RLIVSRTLAEFRVASLFYVPLNLYPRKGFLIVISSIAFLLQKTPTHRPGFVYEGISVRAFWITRIACFAACGGRRKGKDARTPRAPAGGLAALLHHLLFRHY